MPMSERGKIIVIVAPSGAGKSTLIKRLRKEFPQIEESVSCTTRPIREGETQGESYFYLTREEFVERRDRGDFLEWAEVHSNFYGTSKEFVESKLATGVPLLFDLDVQGIDSFKKHFGTEAKGIFIAPPSVEELEARLRNRGTESEDVIQERVANARKEVQRQDDYDYCVVNDDLDRAFEQLKCIFKEIIGLK